MFSFLSPLHSTWEPKVASGKQEAKIDHLVHFAIFLREGFLNGEFGVFFDLEKAYDTT